MTSNDQSLVKAVLEGPATYKVNRLESSQNYKVCCSFCSSSLGMTCALEPHVVYLDRRRCTVIVENGYNIELEVEDELKFNLVAL